jgi:peptidoglycan/xylan/chitin deacetylase (PgdA/CDA1 family)
MRAMMKRLLLFLGLTVLLTSCGRGVLRPDAAAARGKTPLVSFVFDDGNDTDYLLGLKIFAEKGAVACSAVTTDLISTDYHLTPAQIVALRDAGWEIMSHTVTHPHLGWISEERVDSELKRSKEELERLGVPVDNLVYPFNNNDAAVRKITGRYYRSGRGGETELNDGVPDPFFLKSVRIEHDLPLMKNYIDRAFAERSWLIFYYHEIDVKSKVTDVSGTFKKGEMVTLSPSGTAARYTTTLWCPLYGSSMYIVPFSGEPRAGDTVTGATSGATARIDHIRYNDPTLLAAMIDYIKRTYPGMRIVTVDQGLNLLGVPRFRK